MSNGEQPVSQPLQGTEVKPPETAATIIDGQAYFSQSQAAKVWHRNKGTIHRKVKSGALQEFPNPSGGHPLLMAAQLSQVFGLPPSNDAQPVTQPVSRTEAQPPATGHETSDNRLLEVVTTSKDEVIRLLERQLEDLREQLERERENADRWHTAYDQVKALPAPASVPAVVSQPSAAPRSWLDKLLRRVG